MNTVTVSPKFQVVIPKEIREKFHVVPGEKFGVLPFENRIELIPIKQLKKMKGFLRGIKTDILREKDRL
ncbi:MAG: AbrB/MazE/SpoVT family DNA-binding domain-containing protein [Candidatus Aureabacteria bacterium]|nr:AbrB/MazE/SpoVT family DNA-binding domain-containing protein [Candidatus Auribacterota bacterium]